MVCRGCLDPGADDSNALLDACLRAADRLDLQWRVADLSMDPSTLGLLQVVQALLQHEAVHHGSQVGSPRAGDSVERRKGGVQPRGVVLVALHEASCTASCSS